MTVSFWRGGTVWSAGDQAIDQADLRSMVGNNPAVICDGGFANSDVGARLLEGLQRRLERSELADFQIACTTDDQAVRDLAQRLTDSQATGVLVIGGGTAIDLALMATIDCMPQILTYMTQRRSGLVLIPKECQVTLPRLVIPSTLGTGAEVSSAACCDSPAGKHLLLGSTLRPEFAIVDPSVTQGLSASQVSFAIVEILARILVPASQEPVGASSVVAVADCIADGQLKALGSLFHRKNVEGCSDDVRLGLATVSAASHGGWGQLGRGSFSSPIWFLATEVSTIFKVPKSVATGILLPAWAQLVLNGRTKWGLVQRASDRWNAFIGNFGSGDFISDCHEAMHNLVGYEIATTKFLEARIPSVIERVQRRWGNGLPMLGRLSTEDLAELLEMAFAHAYAGKA